MPAALSASTRLALAAGSAFLVIACSGEAAVVTETPAAPAVAVEVLEVAATGAGGDVRASGLVAYKRETALGFGAPGEIESIIADVGDRVAAGQVLATMRRTTTSADANEAALARQTAEQNFERITRLFAAGAASQAELDNARLALERARERISIVAPAGGIVLTRDAEPGQMVAAGQRVLAIGESRTGIIVEASVTAAEAARLRPGDVATIKVKERAPLSGSVARISAKGTQSGLFLVEVQVDQPAGLRSGEVAEVVVAGRSEGQATGGVYLVPAISLIDARADQGIVFMVDAENKARRRAVETGGVSDQGVTILQGLAEGDKVITRGASMVRDGDPVSVAAQ